MDTKTINKIYRKDMAIHHLDLAIEMFIVGEYSVAVLVAGAAEEFFSDQALIKNEESMHNTIKNRVAMKTGKTIKEVNDSIVNKV